MRKTQGVTKLQKFACSSNEDLDSSCVKPTNRVINVEHTKKASFAGGPSGADYRGDAMIKNFSQILNEEPINMCRNQPEETKNYKMI